MKRIFLRFSMRHRISTVLINHSEGPRTSTLSQILTSKGRIGRNSPTIMKQVRATSWPLLVISLSPWLLATWWWLIYRALLKGVATFYQILLYCALIQKASPKRRIRGRRDSMHFSLSSILFALRRYAKRLRLNQLGWILMSCRVSVSERAVSTSKRTQW